MRQALTLALEALNSQRPIQANITAFANWKKHCEPAIAACEAALAKQPEPVAPVDDGNNPEFRKALEHAINCNSMENGSNTPDFILAQHLADCLAAFNKASTHREAWYGRSLSIQTTTGVAEIHGRPRD